MYFTFQRSLIWDGGANRPDPFETPVRIKSKSEERARRKLAPAGLGRVWVLINVEERQNG